MLRKTIIGIGITILLLFLLLGGWSILLSMLNTNAFAPKVKLSETEKSIQWIEAKKRLFKKGR